jgi:transcription elongation factor Elf1
MHTDPLCPYCGKKEFSDKEVEMSRSREKVKLIFCASCGKTVGAVSDYDLILETINGKLGD